MFLCADDGIGAKVWIFTFDVAESQRRLHGLVQKQNKEKSTAAAQLSF